jgi:cell division protein FtsB
MQPQDKKTRFPSRQEASSPHVTSAVGMEETVGRLRARHSSLFTRTVIWITGLVCLAFLLGTLAQAWSNNRLMQSVRQAQQQQQQAQSYNASLQKRAVHYRDPAVIAREARQELGYIRPGEHAVIIVSASDSAQPVAPRRGASPAGRRYWQEWWRVFFGAN